MLSNNDAIRVRIRIGAFLVLIVALGLVARLYYVQIVQHKFYLKEAQDQYTTNNRVIYGKRGEILDNRAYLLVGNVPCVNIFADPGGYLNREVRRRRAALFLARELGLDFNEVYFKLAPERKARGKDGFFVRQDDGSSLMVPVRNAMLARNLDTEYAAELQKKTKNEYIYNLFFKEGTKRSYPKGKMLSNILGFTSLQADVEVPMLGVEKAYNGVLAPRNGTISYERSRRGQPLAYGKHFDSVPSRDGWNVVLTIDERFQSIMEEALDNAVSKWKPQSIYAVMADPYTGRILAAAQRPTFNPEERSKVVNEDAWRLRLLSDGLEPGSIIKPFTIGRGLDAGIITPDSRFDCENGLWNYMNKPLRDSHPYGMLTTTEIIKVSSNIGTAKIALEMGPELVEKTLRDFGFAERTGLGLPAESSGIFPRDARQWRGIGLTRYPIGYGILVTPVQMVRAYCALANGGRLLPLRLVDRVVNPETGEMDVPPQDEGIQMFQKADTCRKLVEMMSLVTQKGVTATAAPVPGYRVAGKTGTSRKYVPGHGYASGKYFASFVGFVPAEKPAFVLLVTVDEPKGAYYGGTVSGPVFREIAERVLKVMNIAPTEEVKK